MGRENKGTKHFIWRILPEPVKAYIESFGLNSIFVLVLGIGLGFYLHSFGIHKGWIKADLIYSPKNTETTKTTSQENPETKTGDENPTTSPDEKKVSITLKGTVYFNNTPVSDAKVSSRGQSLNTQSSGEFSFNYSFKEGEVPERVIIEAKKDSLYGKATVNPLSESIIKISLE